MLNSFSFLYFIFFYVICFVLRLLGIYTEISKFINTISPNKHTKKKLQMNLKKQSQQPVHKSALADKKSFNADSSIKMARKTSFLIPGESSEEVEEESSDYVSDFPDFKKNKVIIELKKRKLSQGKSMLADMQQVAAAANESLAQAKAAANAKSKAQGGEQVSIEEIYTHSKFRPTTPKVFNYFSVPVEHVNASVKKKAVNSSPTNGSFNSSSNMTNSTESRLPKINAAIKENLLSNRMSPNKEKQATDGKMYKNLFFPLLINNNASNTKTNVNGSSVLRKNDNLVAKYTSYLDDPNGVFFLQSMSHVSMKNLNQAQ